MAMPQAPVSPIRGRRIIAWQGWQLLVPIRWSPVKLSGNADDGQLLMADLHRGRVGLRWQKIKQGKRFDAGKWVEKMMVREVGKLANAEARPLKLEDPAWSANRLYVDPKPPGRDVWIGFSARSGRSLELVYHARHRDTVLGNSLVPGLADVTCLKDELGREKDQPAGNDKAQVLAYESSGQCPWSIFDLSLMVPGSMKLADQSMLAGDLKLSFVGPRQRLLVRQVAPASEAIKRQKLEQWLGQILRGQKKLYRRSGKVQPIAIEIGDGRLLEGCQVIMVRRRRFFWKWNEPAVLDGWALVDTDRDRLLVVMGAGVNLPAVVGSIGWASGLFSDQSADQASDQFAD